jgi:hypothetical protein
MDVTRLRKAHDALDEPRPLRALLAGLGEVHLPAHAEQLRGLRR